MRDLVDRIQSCNSLSQLRSLHTSLVTSGLLHHADDAFLHNKLIQAYGSFRATTDARRVFQHLELVRDMFTWDFMLLAYVRNGETELAKELFHSMPCFNPVSSSIMLTALADTGELSQAEAIYQDAPWRSLFLSTAMLNAYSANGDLPRAKYVFDRMPQWDLPAWVSMLTAYARSGELQTLKVVFDRMPERNLVAWTALLSAFSHVRDPHEVAALFEALPEHDLTSWNVLLGVFARSGELQEARRTFQRMPQWDLITWNTLLDGCASCGSLSEAEKVFASMLEADMTSWNTMLAAYAGHPEKLAGFFDSMPFHNLRSSTTMMVAQVERAEDIFSRLPEVDLVACNVMVSVYALYGHLELARVLLEMIPFHDSVSWTALLLGYSAHGNLQESLSVVGAVHVWDSVFRTALLTVYGENGLLDRARKLLEWDVVSCTCLLSAYSCNRRSASATELFNEMKLLTVPDEACLLAALAIPSHTVASARECFISMSFDYNVAPSKHHFSCMASILSSASERLLAVAAELLRTMPFQPEDLDWRCLLSSSITHNNVSVGTMAAVHLLEFDPGDSTAYVLLANASTAAMHGCADPISAVKVI